ncbi:MAG: SDR family NAD(P)-dependent oxidoreductase [Verrucomicrobiaceae bacterium]|nr:MAG: SDR family NAD(P)-dependent oxidoreductase [Verrucomicrobiaceae bacterium]
MQGSILILPPRRRTMSHPMKKNLALVTGCTNGIGHHLARVLAFHGHDLVLVSPDQEEMEFLAIELGAIYGTRCHIIARDLEEESAATDVYDFLLQRGLEVDILANNAGHGYQAKFWAGDIARDISMVNLNICAVLRLTKLILPLMLTRGSGHILNTASVAGCESAPMLAVYHATEAFLLSWSEALASELQDTGVTVTALCSDAGDANFFMQDIVPFRKEHALPPQEIAKAGYEGLMRGDLFVVPGTSNNPVSASRRTLPDLARASTHRARQDHALAASS